MAALSQPNNHSFTTPVEATEAALDPPDPAWGHLCGSSGSRKPNDALSRKPMERRTRRVLEQNQPHARPNAIAGVWHIPC